MPLPKFLALFLFILSLTPVSGVAEQKTVNSGDGLLTELWHGKALTATFRVGVCFEKNGAARGVLILRHANGDEDTYHLYGTATGDKFNLSHSSGHHFAGDLSNPAVMEGKVKLKNGLSLTLKGERSKNATLLADDCAPLPAAGKLAR